MRDGPRPKEVRTLICKGRGLSLLFRGLLCRDALLLFLLQDAFKLNACSSSTQNLHAGRVSKLASPQNAFRLASAAFFFFFSLGLI